MDGILHLAAGITLGVSGGIAFYTSEPLATMFAFGCVVGSVLPDMDRPGSFGSRICPPLSRFLNRKFGHRGFTHAPFAIGVMAGFGGCFGGFNIPIAFAGWLGLMAGCGIHLLQDLFTRQGIPLFYPFNKNKLSFCSAKSGSFWNLPITIGLVIFLVVLFSDSWRQLFASGLT